MRTPFTRLLLAAFAVLTLAGCHGMKEDIAIMCDAPDKVTFPENAKPSEKMNIVATYCFENVSSKPGKEFFQEWAGTGRVKRNKMLRVQAQKYNINPCHLADML